MCIKRMEALGPKLRRQRRRLGLTLDELAGKTGISTPYLSLIETGRVPNPPSDEKLRRLEQTLGFGAGELITQAHLHRTPRDVRAVLQKLVSRGRSEGSGFGVQGSDSFLNPESRTLNPSPINLDDAYLSGVLHELVDKHAGNIEHVSTNTVPVINKVSAGYPKDVPDREAFAARVHGDSMTPKYREGDIVIFSPAAVPKDGDDCFVRFDDGHTTFKRVFFESGDKGAAVIRLQPRNEKYRPHVVPREEITGLYKALFKYQRVDES